MKKKSLKIIVIIILILVLGYFVISFVNAYRFSRLKSPIFVVKHNYKEKGNGYVEQYCSLGYEFIYILNNSKKEKYFNIGCNSIEKYSNINSKKIAYEPENGDNSCVQEKTKLYENGARIYYLVCYNPSNMFYYDENGNKEKIVYALLHNHITLGDLRKAGYEVTFDEKNN